MWQSNLSAIAHQRSYRPLKKIARMILVLFTLFLAPWLTHPATAEIYKYQDEHGRWHITDKLPPGQDAFEVTLKKNKKETPQTPVDLAAKLNEKYQPNSPIEQASLAVVAIKATVGEGSGFFISGDGYILTNRHVAKPTETPQWQALQKQLKESGEAYREADKILRNERVRLNKMERELKDYREEIDRADDNYSKRVAEEDYKYFLNQYLEQKSNYKAVKRNYTFSKKEYEETRREFNILNYSASIKKDFKIILKDETEVTAHLVSVSDKHDLALLKLERYQTPFIRPADSEFLKQGTKVFVIGNPIGLKDVITSGVVAGFKEEHIITDATVLPGNSGGPLTTEQGEVAGIITLKIAQFTETVGFGGAISIDTAYSEFSDYITK